MHPTIIGTARRSSIALLLVLAACGDEGERGMPEASPDGAAGQTATPSPAASAGSSTRLELNISGGPFAGTHQVTDNASCTLDRDTWMVAAGSPGGRGVTQALLMLEGVPPTGGSSGEVTLMVGFGNPMNEADPNSGLISLDPEGGEGTGTGTVRRDGGRAVIELNGTTGDGARVSAVVQCERVTGIQ
jgi:hypothetical protein